MKHIESLAEHRHGVAQIHEVSERAQYMAALEGREEPSLQDYAQASWPEDGVLGGLAIPVRWRVEDDGLVLTEEAEKLMRLLLARARSRELLGLGLGTAAQIRANPGLKALFVGPSGTGKTLAASWLATRLGKPLYRVDVASVMSKYIGETEKQLGTLLTRAERADVVLLFDEADSLFSRRTDVQQASDRYANTQTNYLLERLESFAGIALLTSNAESRFDEAFMRRLEVIVRFAPPGAHTRLDLWRVHLGEKADHLGPNRLGQLAAGADLTGGQISNVVFTAAACAFSAGREISWEDLVEGVRVEYAKIQRSLPSILRE